jgi:hypothetical protein
MSSNQNDLEKVLLEIRLIREENLRINQELRSLASRQSTASKNFHFQIEAAVKKRVAIVQQKQKRIELALLSIIVLLVVYIIKLKLFFL